MSLCWKIYHFFHHKFSKNSNKPPQMHRPVIRINIRRKKIVQKVLFLTTARLWKNGNFSHMTPPEKSEEIRMIFSGGVMCEKLPFFHSLAVVRKSTFLHNFFFSEYRFWSQVGASWVVYLGFLRIYDEKMINFSAQWHIKVFLECKLF